MGLTGLEREAMEDLARRKRVSVPAPRVNWDEIDSVRTRIPTIVEVSIDSVPDGWFIQSDYEKQYGLTHWIAYRQIRRMVEDGHLERKRVSFKGSSVYIYRVRRPSVQDESKDAGSGE